MRTLRNLSISFGKLGFLTAAIILTIASANAFATETPSAAEMRAAKVQEAEQMLSSLGYWITQVDGKSDDSTRQGIIAFQKVEGRARTGHLTGTELKALQSATRPRARYEGFAHIEIDVTRRRIGGL